MRENFSCLTLSQILNFILLKSLLKIPQNILNNRNCLSTIDLGFHWGISIIGVRNIEICAEKVLIVWKYIWIYG